MMAKATPKRVRLDDLLCVHPNAAGLDIGSEEIVVAVPPDRDEQPVRVFLTFTPDLHALVTWLLACGIDTVVMESTGVFWIPIFELLEQAGITPYLVNARHVKTVPGRKSDWNDAQWLQKLHMLGLLQGSFRPDAEIRALRTLVRHRADLIQHRAPHILHMQQALKQMNIQLSVVIEDIMGTTGQAILRAIVNGERDPVILARLRHPNCHSSEETIAKALTGNWQAELLFVLQQHWRCLISILSKSRAVMSRSKSTSVRWNRASKPTNPCRICQPKNGTPGHATDPASMHRPNLYGLWGSIWSQ
jgi:transposase